MDRLINQLTEARVQVTIVVPADVGTSGRKCHLDVAGLRGVIGEFI